MAACGYLLSDEQSVRHTYRNYMCATVTNVRLFYWDFGDGWYTFKACLKLFNRTYSPMDFISSVHIPWFMSFYIRYETWGYALNAVWAVLKRCSHMAILTDWSTNDEGSRNLFSCRAFLLGFRLHLGLALWCHIHLAGLDFRREVSGNKGSWDLLLSFKCPAEFIPSYMHVFEGKFLRNSAFVNWISTLIKEPRILHHNLV